MKKLVRDKIPAIIAAEGKQPRFEEFSDSDIRIYVRRKLDEELSEVKRAKTKQHIAEEIGDLLEVLEKYAELSGIDWDDVLAEKRAKTERVGSFRKNVVLKL